MMMPRLDGQTTYVTGGSSGIGLGIAIAAAARGARVGLIGTSAQKLAAARALLEGRGASVATAVLDVSREADWHAAMAGLEQAIGPPDVLVLNAGIGTESTPVDASPSALWQWTFSVNVMGVVHGLVTCLPGMRARGRPGHVMITSSIAALVAPPGLGPYTTSKAAAIALAETLRAELEGSAIRASVMIPAAVRTDFVSTSNRDAPGEWREAERSAALERVRQMLDAGLDSREVGEYAVDAMLRGDFYIFSHPDFRELIAARQAELLQAIPRDRPLTHP